MWSNQFLLGSGLKDTSWFSANTGGSPLPLVFWETPGEKENIAVHALPCPSVFELS